MALALYRKYRPRTFAEVIGQEHVTEPLSQALRSGRLNHAYLFSGPRGCGKTSSARILARSLNCEQGPTPDPCGVCTSCKSLANDGAGSIDVIEIDAASHGGVDDARELREKAFFAPANSRYKIYVIDEAHMVSSAGFNALLKLVEEPPEFVKFIFATTEPEKVLGTIRSRTHHYPFRLIPPAVLRPYLQTLTEAEGVHVDPAVFPLVVRAGGGSARDTLSVLDQLIAGAGPDGVSYSRAVALLGVTDAALIDEMCDALAAGDGAAAYAAIDRVAEAGHDPRRFASDLLERLRDLIVLQQVPDAVAKGLIDGPADQLEAMAGQAARLGQATLSRCADIVHNGLVEMRGTTAPRLLLELIAARMLLPGAEDSTGALLQRLERLERGAVLDVRVEHPSPSDPGGDVSRAVPAPQDPVGEPAAPVAADGPSAAAGGGGKAAAMAAAAAARRPSGPPARSAAQASDVPVSAAPASAEPVPAAPVSAEPVPAAPVAAAPVPVAPASAGPESVAPVSAAPVASDPAPASGSPAAEEAPDWNAVADGGHDEEPPPWDEEPIESPAPDPAVQAAERLEQVRAAWLDLGRQHEKVGVIQKSGIELRTVEGETVVFGAPTPKYAERFLTYRDVITGAFGRALGGQWQIRCDVGEAPPARATSAGSRPQSAAKRPSSGGPARSSAPAGSAAAAPERNTGRTESRPSRPQRASTADSDDDWPEPARPAANDRQGSPDAARQVAERETGRLGRPDAEQETGEGWPEPARPAGRSAERRDPGADADRETGWPEPARPGESASSSDRDEPTRAGRPQPEPDAASGWPEPARPGGQRGSESSEGSSPTPDGSEFSAASGSRAPSRPGGSESSADSGWPEPARPGAQGGAGGSGSEAGSGWPEPARPGGQQSSGGSGPVSGSGRPGAARPESAGSSEPGAGSGWPEPARPGGVAAAGSLGGPAPMSAGPASSAGPAGGSPLGGGSALGGAAASVSPVSGGAPTTAAPRSPQEAARAAAGRTGNAVPSSGLAAARAAAANAANRAAGVAAARPAPAPAAAARAESSSSWPDGRPVGEAPYDPEYDGPPSAGGSAYEGFDPGDEPLDDVIDEKTARQSSEEQAMQLLRDAFGAEKIGEI